MSDVHPNGGIIPKEPEKTGIAFDIFPLAFACCKLLSSWLCLWGLGYYRFSPSWIALGAVGYLVYTRSRQKRALISGALKAIGSNEKESILNNIGAHELPTWVYFPDIERAEWLNKVIQRLWPYISDYVKEILINNVQPAVNNGLPQSLKPFVFLRTDLGDTPPRIGGVKVYMEESIRRDEIVIDLDLMIYSDARIKVSVGKVIAGVKNFELRGTLRVLMKPLVSKIPFTGAVTVCFLDNPYINFFLTHMGNILTLPGLQQTLHRTIQDAVSSLCVLPNRISISLVDDVSLQLLKFPAAQGVVRINVVSASDLMASDVNLLGKDSSDPYCVIRVGAQKFITSVKKSTLNPNWNECFEGIVEQRFGQSVQLEVWDEDKGSKDDELGWASIPVETIYQKGQLNKAVVLEGVKKGKVHLILTWLELSSIPSDLEKVARNRRGSSPSEKLNSTCYLFVRVEQAKNLRRIKFIQEPSPYCILQLGNLTQNTVVKEKTQNPIWESLHHFIFSNPEIEQVNIEVRDSRTECVLGTCSVPLKHLMAETNMSVTRPYTLKASATEGACLYLHIDLRILVPGEVRDFSGDHSTPASPSPHSDDLENPESTCHKSDEYSSRYSPSNTPNASPQTSPLLDIRSLVAPVNPMGRIRLTIRYEAELEIMEVTVHRAENLIALNKDGLSDPYVKLHIIHDRTRNDDVKRTKIIRGALNPVFEESFDFAIKETDLAFSKLHVEVKNHLRMFSSSSALRFIGSTVISLQDVGSSNEFSEWYWLTNNQKPLKTDHATRNSGLFSFH